MTFICFQGFMMFLESHIYKSPLCLNQLARFFIWGITLLINGNQFYTEQRGSIFWACSICGKVVCNDFFVVPVKAVWSLINGLKCQHRLELKTKRKKKSMMSDGSETSITHLSGSWLEAATSKIHQTWTKMPEHWRAGNIWHKGAVRKIWK